MGEFATFEGGECQYSDEAAAGGPKPAVAKHAHFLCALCFGGYLLRACSAGGVFEREILNPETGVVVSASGQLPCPFFRYHVGSQLVRPGATVGMAGGGRRSTTAAAAATTTAAQQGQKKQNIKQLVSPRGEADAPAPAPEPELETEMRTDDNTGEDTSGSAEDDAPHQLGDVILTSTVTGYVRDEQIEPTGPELEPEPEPQDDEFDPLLNPGPAGEQADEQADELDDNTTAKTQSELALAFSNPKKGSTQEKASATQVCGWVEVRMDCKCGAIPMSEIETVLLDPRNNSFQYWRHRMADTLVTVHAATTALSVDATGRRGAAAHEQAAAAAAGDAGVALVRSLTAEMDETEPCLQWKSMEITETDTEDTNGAAALEQQFADTGPSAAAMNGDILYLEYSLEDEILGLGLTPANAHETARLRVAIAANSALADEMKQVQLSYGSAGCCL